MRYLLCFIFLSYVCARQLISPEQANYPRVIVLSRQMNTSNNGLILAAFTSYPSGGNNGVGVIDGSRNNGDTFSRVGTVKDPDAAKGLAIGTVIFELPSKVGDMPAGTILWVGVTGQKKYKNMAIKMWKSSDAGVTWEYVSTLTAAHGIIEGGLWEPELLIAKDGHLVCHFADETKMHTKKHSQTLQQVWSIDGIKWNQKQPTVALGNFGFRPGMPVVRQLSESLWIMTYEICGRGKPQYNCAATYRTSTDGKNWGDPTKPGAMIKDNQNRFFKHTPNIAFSPSTGVLVVSAQTFVNSKGDKIPGENGATLFQTDIKLKEWRSIKAPISIPDAHDDICLNYSPAMVFLEDGKKLLEVSTDYNKEKVCMAYYATQNMY